ncbi:MAG: serine acetyltransferase [Bacteroidaceae bacterium]|nr:serine acetyltransferase [Bacteroidaceae bacterium]
MNPEKFAHQFTRIVDELSDCTDMEKNGFFHEYKDSDPIPSSKALEEIMELCRAIFFPGYYGKSSINHATLKYNIGVNVERLYTRLSQQVVAGLCFGRVNAEGDSVYATYLKAEEICCQIVNKLPEMRATLETDVIAAYNGDPAAMNFGEVISCYPAVKALTNYRLAHELHRLNVPLIPRILTEIAHSETGIDIHPGAQIGRYFTIDHGTGVVIGATTVIGNHVKLYQGVTLGAKSFPLDENGNPIKGIPRHPIIEDDVIIYSNATILGRITIGRGAVIGGNLWVTDDVPAGARLVQYRTGDGQN